MYILLGLLHLHKLLIYAQGANYIIRIISLNYILYILLYILLYIFYPYLAKCKVVIRFVLTDCFLPGNPQLHQVNFHKGKPQPLPMHLQARKYTTKLSLFLPCICFKFCLKTYVHRLLRLILRIFLLILHFQLSAMCVLFMRVDNTLLTPRKVFSPVYSFFGMYLEYIQPRKLNISIYREIKFTKKFSRFLLIIR